MKGILMWMCALGGTAVLGVLIWGAMIWFGKWSKQRDELERAKLQEEWKRRAAERKAAQEGGAAPASDDDETGENPPMY